MYDILIAGAGPAGMTSAIYGARGNKKTIMIERDFYGGNITGATALENYPGIKSISGMDFAKEMYEQAIDLGAEFEYGNVVSVDKKEEGHFIVKTEEGKEYETKSVILATGVKNAMGIPRERELTGRGVSYCATCDGMFFRTRDVVVLGGGNGAIKDAEYLADGCSKVYVVTGEDEFKAVKPFIERISKRDNVELISGFKAKELLGENMVSGLVIEDEKTGEKRTLEVSGVFVSLGKIPQNRSFSEFMELDEKGFANSGETCVTETPGIFVAGDCRRKTLRQVVTAASDGAEAAHGAIEYIRGLK